MTQRRRMSRAEVEHMTRAPWRRWRCDLRLASMVWRYRRRRPVAGLDAHDHWQRRAMSRWMAAAGVGWDATWLRLGRWRRG